MALVTAGWSQANYLPIHSLTVGPAMNFHLTKRTIGEIGILQHQIYTEHVLAGGFKLGQGYNSSEGWPYGEPAFYVKARPSLPWRYVPSTDLQITPTAGESYVSFEMRMPAGWDNGSVMVLLPGIIEIEDEDRAVVSGVRRNLREAPVSGGPVLPGTTVPITEAPRLWASIEPGYAETFELNSGFQGWERGEPRAYTMSTDRAGPSGLHRWNATVSTTQFNELFSVVLGSPQSGSLPNELLFVLAVDGYSYSSVSSTYIPETSLIFRREKGASSTPISVRPSWAKSGRRK